MASLPKVPVSLVKSLFPHPDLSIALFLDFPLPTQNDGTFGVSHIDATQFWSKYEPESFNETTLSLIQKLLVPSPKMLELCREAIDSMPNRHEIKSIAYTHLPSTHSASNRLFPLWIYDYWIQVSQLRQFVRFPWKKAENWAANQELHCFQERGRLANDIHQSLKSLPWTGRILGFSDPEPLTKLSCYLSNKWLATTHIEQQLDLLRLRLDMNMDVQHDNHSNSSETCEIVGTQFFPKVISLFRHHRSSYSKDQAPGGS